MKRKMLASVLLSVFATLTFGAGITMAAHPDITLYTYEEVGEAFGQPGGMMPVMFQNWTDQTQPGFMAGMPYSPKMTCGNCHNGTTTSWDGQVTDLPADMVSYEEMSKQAFHAELGAEAWGHADPTELGDPDDATSQFGKPWSRTNGMWGKW
ncbi:MAG: hypothetical protein C0618_11080 [Desulfuromonas sp.]|nr:MAG: hypothetical protein C0618_11080 [Desulfuromonas sp.]